MTTCLVLGGAETLHDDLARYDGPIDGCVACNDAGAEWSGRLDAWVTLHPEFWDRKGWAGLREGRDYPAPERWVCHHGASGPVPNGVIRTDYLFPGQAKSGSSGLFAAKVALCDLGFDRVVLCGIPMDHIPHFYGGDPWRAQSVRDYREQWLTVPMIYRARMRSMGGWTRENLGGPDA